MLALSKTLTRGFLSTAPLPNDPCPLPPGWSYVLHLRHALTLAWCVAGGATRGGGRASWRGWWRDDIRGSCRRQRCLRRRLLCLLLPGVWQDLRGHKAQIPLGATHDHPYWRKAIFLPTVCIQSQSERAPESSHKEPTQAWAIRGAQQPPACSRYGYMIMSHSKGVILLPCSLMASLYTCMKYDYISCYT